MKLLALASLIFVAATMVTAAQPLRPPPPPGLLIEADWQSPQQLPRRFRNHCVYDASRHRAWCSEHCGYDYQFYYCSKVSYGCCRIDFGYCDWQGLLRCHP